MQPPADHSVTYTNSQASGGTNHFGHVYHYSNEPGGRDGNQCLRDLRVTDPREDRERIEDDKDRLLRDCYAWILDDANFQRWETQDESRLLWIKGAPGKGKTMMMMGLVDELSRSKTSRAATPLLSDDSTPLLSFFFCQNTNPVLNNAVSVLRGLIYMLAKQRAQLLRHVLGEYTVAGKHLFEGHNAVYSLRKILLNMLDDPSLPSTYLLIDALDECTSGLSELLRVITNASRGLQSQVKWVVTSRNIPEIERYLHTDALGVKLSLEVEASHVTRAVAAFVDYKVQRLATMQQYDPELKAEVQQQLHNKAEGTFLWVSLVCKELEKVPLYRTREVLQALPPGLDSLYDRMIAQVLAQDERTVWYCRSILRAITLVFRPLNLEELAAVAGLPSEHFGSVQAVIDLVGCCGLFLTVREGVASFIHLSAKDYFTAGKGRQVCEGTPAEEHGRTTELLLGSMSRVLKRDMCNLLRPGSLTEEVLATGQIKKSVVPQVAYACEYWVEHLIAGWQSRSNLLADGGKVHSFLQEHLLHWLEAMSLLQRMSDALAALDKLGSVLSVRESLTKQQTELRKGTESCSLPSFVHDATRFAIRGGPGIKEAPLQVYYGALLFAPRRSLIRQHFAQELPGWVQSISGLDEDWGPLWQTIEGHTRNVTSVAFSAQGDKLASASEDETVRIWDAKTGQPLHTLTGHKGSVKSVVFLAADQLASASNDKTVRIWDAKTGQLLHILKGHTKAITNVAFSAVTERLATSSDDMTVQVWDAKTGQSLHMLNRSTEYVNSLAFSGAGDRLATALNDGMVQIWDAETGKPLLVLNGHTEGVTSVAFSAGGNQLASASDDKTVRVWNADNGQLLHTLRGHTAAVTSLAFSPVGDRLASTSEDCTVRMWDVQTGQPLQLLKGHADFVCSVAFSRQGDRLASASEDWTVRLWDAKIEGTSQSDEDHTRYIYNMVFSPQGERLASASWDTTIRLWDAKTRQLLHTLRGHTDDVFSMVFSPAGDLLISVADDNTVRIWDAHTGQLLQKITHEVWQGTGLTFSRNGSCLKGLSAHGEMLITLSVPSAPTLSHQPPEQRILVADRWLILDFEAMLWIPVDFDPGIIEIRGIQVAFGSISGRVLLLTLSYPMS